MRKVIGRTCRYTHPYGKRTNIAHPLTQIGSKESRRRWGLRMGSKPDERGLSSPLWKLTPRETVNNRYHQTVYPPRHPWSPSFPRRIRCKRTRTKLAAARHQPTQIVELALRDHASRPGLLEGHRIDEAWARQARFLTGATRSKPASAPNLSSNALSPPSSATTHATSCCPTAPKPFSLRSNYPDRGDVQHTAGNLPRCDLSPLYGSLEKVCSEIIE